MEMKELLLLQTQIIIIYITLILPYLSMQKQDTSNNSSKDQQQFKPRKNKYQFNLDRGRKILIDSDFDNGNIGLIRQVTELQYRLEAISDSKSAAPKKTWFHFRVLAHKSIRIRFIIQNVSIYENMYEQVYDQVEEQNWAKPVMNDGQGWKEVKDCFLTYRGEVGIVIDYSFTSENFVYFAMAVPHSYEESEKYLKDLRYRIPDHVQYEDQIIAQSLGGLNLHLLRFTAKQWQNGVMGLNKCLSQNKNNLRVHSQVNIENTLGIMSNIRKPIIFITSRVHPGEVGSSQCLMGIIDFLTRPFNLQSYLILKMFEILIIPIVNPDGVYEGNYRMDLNNNNLNRVYNDPSPQLHPTIYRIKQIVTNLITPTKEKTDKLMTLISRKIMFHFDLHSHSCIKSAFIYGNAFDKIVIQTQSELYCRLLEQNTEVFKYGLSHFGQKHMKMKDKGEPLTKQGCARVVVSKMANVVYSYTVQTSIFPYMNKQALLPASNVHFQLADHLYYDETKAQDIISRYGIKNELFIDNMLLGHGIMISILDLLEKNPYSRLPNLEQTLDLYRRQISQNLIQSEERFKLMDMKAYQKVKNIVKCCKQEFTFKYKKYWEYLLTDKLITTAKWPSCFKSFQFANINNIEQDAMKKKNRIKTQSTQLQRNINDFIYPKNMRKRYMNLEAQLINQPTEGENKAERTQISPMKTAIASKNLQIFIDMKPNTAINVTSKNNSSATQLPQIRSSYQRISIRSRTNSQTQSQNPRILTQTKKQDIEHMLEKKQARQLKADKEKQIVQIKQIKELTQKQSTKNIVLSFIQEQMEKINTMRRNIQKSVAVQSRLASYKLGKKTSKSTKILQSVGYTGTSRYGQLLISESNNELNFNRNKKSHINDQIGESNHNKKKKEEQQQQYEEEQGIYYVNEDKQDQDQSQARIGKLKQAQRIRNLNIHSLPRNRTNINKNTGSLQKISQYPLYPLEKEKQPLATVITSKRELAKLKFSQIKRKNIIRQDISHNIKLPELKGTSTQNNSQNGNIFSTHSITTNTPQQEPKNGSQLKINLNVNLNVNVCIDGQSRITGRVRAATLPDDI